MSPAEFSLDLGRVQASLAGDSDRAATAAGEHLLQAANVHVPLEEGTLERSGAVSTTTEEGVRTVVVVSYDTPYAVAQHEDLTFEHDPGRTAKFLENAMHAERATMLAIVAGELQLP